MYSDLGSTILEIELHRFRALANLSGTMKTYIAAGKQQWGIENTFSSKTVIFQLPYKEAIPSVVSSSSGSSAKSAVNANSLISFNAYNQAAQTIWWISVGAQQWGIKLAESVEYPYIWAFPVSFASQNFGVFAINNEMSINSGAIGVYDVDTQSAKIALYGRDNDNAAFLFAIGQ